MKHRKWITSLVIGSIVAVFCAYAVLKSAPDPAGKAEALRRLEVLEAEFKALPAEETEKLKAKAMASDPELRGRIEQCQARNPQSEQVCTSTAFQDWLNTSLFTQFLIKKQLDKFFCENLCKRSE